MAEPSPMQSIKMTQRGAQALKRWQAGQRAADKQQWAAAAREYQQATVLAPHDTLFWMSLASTQIKLALADAAEKSARQAVKLEPGNPLALTLLSEVLNQQQRHAEVADLLGALPPAVPRDARMLQAQGTALLHAERAPEAITVFLEALKTDMFNAQVHQLLGVAFLNLKRPRDAALCFETAASVDKTGLIKVQALSLLVYQLQQATEWRDLAKHSEVLLAAMDDKREDILASIEPFTMLAVASSPAQQLRVGRARARSLQRGIKPLPRRGPRAPGRLRIGYLSCDFCNHATALLVCELLELRDRERFEVFLYCHSPDDGSPIQQRARAAGDHYRDVRQVGDAALAQLMRDDGIDIAIDLKGYTKGTRNHVLAARPAPLQVAFLGYPATSGADFLDYFIGDPVATPLTDAANFSECIAQMPHSYQPNDSQRELGPRPSRRGIGLPEDAIVLCCFNQSYKLTAEMIELWAQILRKTSNTVLWLMNWTAAASGQLVRELQARGAPPERLYFAEPVSVAENLARLQCADLFLDTWPCNAHTTASEALWAGVPVLTVPGQTFASRVAASLVTACGLPELVCASPQAYVAKAISLSQPELPALRAAQQHLLENRRQLPLFNSQRYAHDFEDLLQRMWNNHEAGLAPAALPVLTA